MTSIQTKEDFLRALADDPAFKTAVREALMSEVLADILDELRESRKTQELILASIGRMAGDINSMATDIGHLIGDNLERKTGSLWRLSQIVCKRSRAAISSAFCIATPSSYFSPS